MPRKKPLKPAIPSENVKEMEEMPSENVGKDELTLLREELINLRAERTKILDLSLAARESKREEPAADLSPKEKARRRLEDIKSEEMKMVKGVFRNYEQKDAAEYVEFRKYPGIPTFKKWMHDGKDYEVPLYVARYLNGVDAVAPEGKRQINCCAYPVCAEQSGNTTYGDDGLPVPNVHNIKWVKRIGFESTGFAAV